MGRGGAEVGRATGAHRHRFQRRRRPARRRPACRAGRSGLVPGRLCPAVGSPRLCLGRPAGAASQPAALPAGRVAHRRGTSARRGPLLRPGRRPYRPATRTRPRWPGPHVSCDSRPGGRPPPRGGQLGRPGPHRMAYLSRPVQVYQLCHPDLGAGFPLSAPWTATPTTWPCS